MPYIPQPDRLKFKKSLDNLTPNISKKGELTYIAYALLLGYIQRNGKSYQNLSDACAGLTDAVDEFKRRVMFPYEDEKIIQNGDVII